MLVPLANFATVKMTLLDLKTNVLLHCCLMASKPPIFGWEHLDTLSHLDAAFDIMGTRDLILNSPQPEWEMQEMILLQFVKEQGINVNMTTILLMLVSIYDRNE